MMRFRLFFLGIVFLFGLVVFLDGAQAAIFTVNSAADTDDGSCDPLAVGDCTLREAINAANATVGMDTIAFNIPGPGPHTIQATSRLPTITDAVIIDGYTQPGASPNTNPITQGSNAVLKIELNGSNAGANANGLTITAGNSTVQGLVINRFAAYGLVIHGNGATNNAVTGNFIGTDATGTVALGNFIGASIQSDAGAAVSNNSIGGTTAAERNIISGNHHIGVYVSGPTDGNQILGNLVGTDVTGSQALPNDEGVFISGSFDNTMGGNLISGNRGRGLTLEGSSATGNGILSNSIFSNGGLGIDLGPRDGVTANDVGDGDTGPNNFQNFPELTSATSGATSITIVGTLNSTSSTTFRLEFFANTAGDPSGYGEGESFIGSANVATGAEETPGEGGNVSFTVTLPTAVPPGHFITATATDPSNNTSEFSESITMQLQALWVFPAFDPPNEVTDPSLRESLVNRSAASGVDALYVSVYRYPENSAGRRMYEDSDMADLIAKAHGAGIEVWATYGDPPWPQQWADYGCDASGTCTDTPLAWHPYQRIQDVLAYNNENPLTRFDGVILDVESSPSTETEFQNLLTLYQGFLNTLQPNGLGLAVAISAFWNDEVEFPAGTGSTEPAYEHIIDLDLDKVVVMGYRDLAGTPCPANGIICLNQDEIAYADTLGKANLILAGLETSNCAPGTGTGECDGESVTFFEEGQEVLNQEAHAVAEHFDTNPSFGGFAIHRYRHSYLGELLGWPPFNGGFPIETNTPEGANIVVEPVDATTGTTPVTVTFFEVPQPGNTSLTTSGVGPTPPTGFKLGDPPTYYDLTTTADFVPPIEVCIDYSGISFTGPEEDLRLFHFEDPDWVDHTLLPVDTANKMICASVTSLSPFAVFEPENQPPVVGEITAPVDPIQVNMGINTSANFSDSDVLDTHTAVWDWGDGSTSPGTVTETDGSGSVTGGNTYTTPGVYTVNLTVTDKDGDSGQSDFQYVVVYDPDGGFVTGGGRIHSREGACRFDGCTDQTTGRANFGFVSKYKKGADVPTGNTQFQFKAGNLNFHSTSYQWLVVAGPQAKFKGQGTINGEGTYGFMLTARDGQINGGGGVDRFRIKIWDKATEEVVYDNQMGDDPDDADASDTIEGGSIVIHKK